LFLTPFSKKKRGVKKTNEVFDKNNDYILVSVLVKIQICKKNLTKNLSENVAFVKKIFIIIMVALLELSTARQNVTMIKTTVTHFLINLTKF
jgi:hypothetical protein